jgi:type II secretory pathway component PulK
MRSRVRRGAVLIMALVCLVLIGVMGGALLQWAAREHKLLRSRDEQSQAHWLAEAGLERAAARLADDADYTGETWRLATADLPSGDEARVSCHVATIDGRPERRWLEVEVEYPLGSAAPVRVRKRIVYQLSPGDTE